MQRGISFQVWNVDLRACLQEERIRGFSTNNTPQGLVLITPSTNNAVAESVERRLCVEEIGSSVPGGVKPMTYKIDTRCFMAWCSALIGQCEDWLAQGQDNVTEWDIRSWCQ